MTDLKTGGAYTTKASTAGRRIAQVQGSFALLPSGSQGRGHGWVVWRPGSAHGALRAVCSDYTRSLRVCVTTCRRVGSVFFNDFDAVLYMTRWVPFSPLWRYKKNHYYYYHRTRLGLWSPE